MQDIESGAINIDKKIKEFLNLEMNKENIVNFCVYLNSNVDNKAYF